MPYDIFGLGSSPFARHYLGNHYLFSLPAGTKMFQFPAFAFVTYCHKCRRFAPAGFPIRISTLQRLLAPQRGFSQLVTSFFAYESLGIHHTPFLFVIRLSSLTYTFRYISERKHTSAVFFFKTSDDLLYYQCLCSVFKVQLKVRPSKSNSDKSGKSSLKGSAGTSFLQLT